MVQVKLKVMNGTHAGKSLKLPQPQFLIGRSQDCHLRPDSDLISRHHCAVVVDGNYVGLRDFGSKNGTYVNDERVVGECELKAGDRLRVGPLLFEIVVDHPIGRPKRPAVSGVKDVANRTAQAARSVSDDDANEWIAGPESADAASADTVEATPEEMKDTGSIKIGDTLTDQPAKRSARPGPVPLSDTPASELDPLAETQAAESPATSAQPFGAQGAAKPAGKRFWKRSKDKPAPGKLPPPPPVLGGDSSSAAADILKRLNRRR